MLRVLGTVLVTMLISQTSGETRSKRGGKLSSCKELHAITHSTHIGVDYSYLECHCTNILGLILHETSGNLINNIFGEEDIASTTGGPKKKGDLRFLAFTVF